MKQATVKIKGIEYIIKKCFAALMEFEKLTGKNAYNATSSITDSLTMYYSLLVVNNDTFTLSLKEFLECLDEDDTIIPSFHKYLASLVEPEKAVKDKKKVETR